MIYPEDIRERIESEFGEQKTEVIHLLDNAVLQTADLKNGRIIRCILFLAGKDITKLKMNIRAAAADPRDVMYWAEYANHGQRAIRVRDFSRPFSEAEV